MFVHEYWANQQLIVEFDHENFALYKVIFGKKIRTHKDKIRSIEDIYYRASLGFRSVVIQARIKAKGLGRSLRHEEARWLVDLLRAWLSEHQ